MDHLANAVALVAAQERIHELGVPHISADDEPGHDEPRRDEPSVSWNETPEGVRQQRDALLRQLKRERRQIEKLKVKLEAQKEQHRGDSQSNANSLWQVKPADKPEVKLYFNMAPEKQTQEAWETWGYVDTDRKQWSRENGQVGVKWEVSGGWIQIKHDVIIPEDKIAIIFYIPEKKQSKWKQYISTYKGGRLMNLISKYPRSPCKSYIMIGRNYQVGDGEIIDLIHDVSQTF